jgi:predicted RNA-binding Zn-ribbon protein involved in translation (DUF1610 family)
MPTPFISSLYPVRSGSSSLTPIRESTIEKVTMMRAYKLYHPKCGNTWIYKGKSPFFATCTWCGLKISVDKHRVDNLTGNGDARDN